MDIIISLVDLPTTVKGFTRENADGTYSIVLNARMDAETRLKCYEHELDHIAHDDLRSGVSVGRIEAIRHKNREAGIGRYRPLGD